MTPAQGDDGRTAVVVVPEASIAAVREHTRAVRVRLVSASDRTVEAELRRVIPGGSSRLPSSAVGSAAGGDIPVDARDVDGTRALGQVFSVELALPREARAPYGARLYARFEHAPEPLAGRIERGLRRAYLHRFGG